jgi:hypothetical protein
MSTRTHTQTHRHTDTQTHTKLCSQYTDTQSCVPYFFQLREMLDEKVCDSPVPPLTHTCPPPYPHIQEACEYSQSQIGTCVRARVMRHRVLICIKDRSPAYCDSNTRQMPDMIQEKGVCTHTTCTKSTICWKGRKDIPSFYWSKATPCLHAKSWVCFSTAASSFEPVYECTMYDVYVDTDRLDSLSCFHMACIHESCMRDWTHIASLEIPGRHSLGALNDVCRYSQTIKTNAPKINDMNKNEQMSEHAWDTNDFLSPETTTTRTSSSMARGACAHSRRTHYFPHNTPGGEYAHTLCHSAHPHRINIPYWHSTHVHTHKKKRDTLTYEPPYLARLDLAHFWCM